MRRALKLVLATVALFFSLANAGYAAELQVSRVEAQKNPDPAAQGLLKDHSALEKYSLSDRIKDLDGLKDRMGELGFRYDQERGVFLNTQDQPVQPYQMDNLLSHIEENQKISRKQGELSSGDRSAFQDFAARLRTNPDMYGMDKAQADKVAYDLEATLRMWEKQGRFENIGGIMTLFSLQLVHGETSVAPRVNADRVGGIKETRTVENLSSRQPRAKSFKSASSAPPTPSPNKVGEIRAGVRMPIELLDPSKFKYAPLPKEKIKNLLKD